MSRVNFIFDTNQQSAALSRLIAGYDSTATVDPSSAVRMDKQVAFSLQPVTVTLAADGTPLYAPDFLPTDDYFVAIGNSDQPATSGTFYLAVDGNDSGLLSLAYNITGQALTTPLSAAFVAAGKPACTATLLTTGVYKIVGNTNGVITSDLLVCDPTNLDPDCDSQVVVKQLGDTGSPYILLLVMRQAPMVLANPTTLLPATGVSVNSVQAGTSTADQIKSVDFTVSETYSGTYTVGATIQDAANVRTIIANTIANPTIVQTSAAHGYTTGDSVSISGSNSTPTIDGTRTVTVTDATHFSVAVNVTVNGTTGSCVELVSAQCGIAKPTFSAEEFALMLTNHPLIFYKAADGTADTITVNKSGTSEIVSFIGVLGRSALPALTAANINLVGATGLSGVLNYNTVELFEYSLSQEDQFNLPLTIQRRRLDGERRTVFGPVDVTIYKDNLDPMTMIPVEFPTFADWFYASDLSGGPTSDPGGGKPWLNGSVLSVGPP